jgi:4-methyl-5(b-hydroxyethyl)-thiazole monophosphate biosynthesis
MRILVPLAEGFEEIEAVTTVDLLRRAGIDIITASLKSSPVTGSHNITLKSDITFNENEKFDAIVLPGGMPGSANLKNDKRIINIIQKISKEGGITAAICAAPIVLSAAGLLKGKKFTCYPGYEDEITGGVFVKKPVVVDGRIITAAGPACAPLFALKLIEIIKGEKTSEEIKKQIISFW